MSKRNKMWVITCVFFWLVLNPGSADTAAQILFQTSFARGVWNPTEWTMVKSPRWSYVGEWVQGESYIQNKTPEDATSKEMFGTRSAETYTSMVLNRKFNGKITIRATMEFSDRMAPLIVLAPKLGNNKDGIPEYREHFEIVLWDEGVNIWHHYFKDGKPFWKLAAYEHFKLMPNTKYALKVECSRRMTDKMLSVLVNGHKFGYMDNSLPDEYYVGITGCEGINRFYDFVVTK